MIAAAQALEIHEDLRQLQVLQWAQPVGGKDKREQKQNAAQRTADIKNYQYEMERLLYGEREAEAPSHKPVEQKLKQLAGKGKVLPMHKRKPFKKPGAAK